MAHLAVTVALLFLACAYASPATERGNQKFTFLKDSSFGAAAATDQGKAHGLVESNSGLDTTMETPVDTGDNITDVALVDNVNAGYAFASGGSVATGLLKNNKFAKDPTKPANGFPSFGFF